MYSVEYVSTVGKQIRAIPKKERVKVFRRIAKLAQDPRPPGAKKLKGEDSLYRVRQGGWRVVYTIEDEKLIVLVVKVGHRSDVYR